MLKTFVAGTLASLLALLLVLSLSGCASSSPVLIPQPRVPAPDPELMTPPSTEDYSARAQADMKAWRQTLESLRRR